MQSKHKVLTAILCASQCVCVGLANADQAKPVAGPTGLAPASSGGQKPATLGGMPGTSGMTSTVTATVAPMAVPSKLLTSDAAMNLAHPSVELKASLYSNSSSPLAARPLVFKVDGKTVGTVQTGADGRATFNYSPVAAPAAGSYTWSASFEGDSTYKSSTSNATLIVNKQASTLVIDSSNITWDQQAFTHRVHFSGLLTGYADHDPIKADDGISASIDGKKIENLKTDAQGRFEGDAMGVPTGSRILQIEFQGNAKYANSMEGKTLTIPPSELYFWFPEGVGTLHDKSPYGFGDMPQPAHWITMDCSYNKTGDLGTFMVGGFPISVKVHVTKDNSASGRPASAVNTVLNFPGGPGKTDANGDVVLTYTLPANGSTVQLRAYPTDSMFTGSGLSSKYPYPPAQPADACIGGSSNRQYFMPVH